jgi:hypothetical protein
MLRLSSLSTLFNAAVRIGAWVLLVIGLLMGMAWATLHFWIVPRIEDFRPKFESITSHYVGVPVKMGQLVAVSSGWMPTFEIHQLSLIDPEGRPALTLPKVIFAISIRSVLQLGVEQLVIESPTLDIRRTSQGDWWIAGLTLHQTGAIDSAAADWIFSQKEVVIQNGTIHWNDEFNSALPEKSALSLSQVSWVLRNSARRHHWRLDATPAGGWGDRFVFMGDLRRSLLSTHPGRFQDWTGQIHAHFPDVDLARLGPHLPQNFSATEGKGALRIWADLSRGELKQVTADVFLEQAKAQLGPKLQALSFNHIAGRLSAKPLQSGFDFATQDLRFDTPDGLHWPGGNVKLTYTEEKNGQSAKGVFHGDKLDLVSLRNIALQLPLPEEYRLALSEHKVSGLVEVFHLDWSERHNVEGKSINVNSANGRVDHFSLEGGKTGSRFERLPGIENAHIDFEMTPEGGQLKADISKGAVSLERSFEEPRIALDKMQAAIKWQVQKGSVSVPDWQLSLSNADLAGAVQGSWKPSPLHDSLGILNLQGNISRGNANVIHRYLPNGISAEVRHYLRDALLKGSIQNVAVKVKGDLALLPFANPKEGELRFVGKVNDVQYAYAPKATNAESPWPAMNNVTGDLVIDRLSLKLNGASGKWGSVPFTQIKAEIPNMTSDTLVNVQGESKANAKQVLTELRQSPVNNMLNGLFTQASSTGVFNTRLKLALPLMSLDKSSVQGVLSFTGNDVRMLPSVPTFEKVQGAINFNESGFSLAGISAQFLGGPVKLEGGSRKLGAKSTEANPLIKMQGQVSAQGLQQASDIPWLNFLAQQAQGTTAYAASLGFKGAQSELSVQSQLQGMALDLPSPLGKRADEMLAVRFENTLVSNTSGSTSPAQKDILKLNWGRALSASFTRDLRTSDPKILNGRWVLGDAPGTTVSPTDTGVMATINVPHLPAGEWLQFLNAAQPNRQDQTTKGINVPSDMQAFLPTRFNLSANELSSNGRTLHQVIMNGSRDGALWRSQLEAKELNGYLEYRQASAQNTARVYARFARLNLPPSADQTVASLLDDGPVAIPALDIVIDDLELRGKKLGRVEIEAVNADAGLLRTQTGNEWRLNKLNITAPEASFKANGKWMTARDKSQATSTEMNFTLDISDSGELLNRLGTKDALKGGSGKLQGQVSWQGSPLSFHYPSMNGQFNVNIGRGQFLQADPGVAKLLGVLSLQALPRRLLLDFRDVFSEGFAFDTVRGDVTIQQGQASTRNLQMKGVNALVQMEGSSDIARETQNLRVLIIPEVDAGTASLLAGVALNPAIGLSTFLAQLILRRPLSRVNTQEFSIEGTWADPKVTKVSSNASAIEKID